jgi:hypothetical protein
MMTSSPELEASDVADSRVAIEEALVNLDSGWIVLADLQIGTPLDASAADYIVLHGARGIALVDIAPGRPEDPVEPFRRFLDIEGFSGFFPGFLPIVRLVVEPPDEAISSRLDEAFAVVGAPTIEDPEWAEAINTLLVAPAPLAAPEPQALVSPAAPSQTERDRLWSAEAPHTGIAQPFALSPTAGGTRLIAPSDEAPWIHDDLADRTNEKHRPRRWLTATIVLAGLVGGYGGWMAFEPAYQEETGNSSPPSVAIPMSPSPQSTASRSTSAPTAPFPQADDPRQDETTGARVAISPPPVPKPAPEPAQTAKQASPQPTALPEALSQATPPVVAPPSTPVTQIAPTVPPPVGNVTPPAPGPIANFSPEATATPPTPQAKPAPLRAKPTIARAAPSTSPKPQAALVKPAPNLRPDRQQSEPPPAMPQVTAPERELSAPPAGAPSSGAAEPRSGGPPVDAADLPRLDETDLPSQTAVAVPPPPPARTEAASVAAVARSKPLSLLPRAEPEPPPATTGSTVESRVAAPLTPPTGDGRVCRIYTATRTVLGQPQAVKGLACRLPDGRWQPVTEAPDR